MNFNYAKTLIEKRHRCIRWPLIGSIKLFGIHECLLESLEFSLECREALWALLNAALKLLPCKALPGPINDRLSMSCGSCNSEWIDSRSTLPGNLDNVEAPIHQADFLSLFNYFVSFVPRMKGGLSDNVLRRSKWRSTFTLSAVSYWESPIESLKFRFSIDHNGYSVFACGRSIAAPLLFESLWISLQPSYMAADRFY